jgi:hypothetical protein
MTTRDRTIILVLAVAAVIGAFWFMVFSPRRHEVASVNTQLVAARQSHDEAVSSAAVARTAKASYLSDRTTIAKLGKAVPTNDDPASLIYQLNAAAGGANVDFHSLQLGSTGDGSTTSSTPTAATPTEGATAALPPGAVVGPGGLSKLPFTLTFEGGYFGLEKFLRRMQSFTTVNGNKIVVNGRLFSVDAIALVPGPNGFPQLQANLTASAYIAPAATTPATASTATGSTGSTPSSTPSAPTTAAVVTGVGR